MKGDRVEAVVDTGQGVQTFDIVATKAGRRIEVVTTRGVVEVREVTRSGNPVRTARFNAVVVPNRNFHFLVLIAIVVAQQQAERAVGILKPAFKCAGHAGSGFTRRFDR